jgi:hypothetical protein
MRNLFRSAPVVVICCIPILIAAVFVFLKQIGEISWPWLWILSPIWIAVGGYLCVISVAGLVLRFMVRTGSKIP